MTLRKLLEWESHPPYMLDSHCPCKLCRAYFDKIKTGDRQRNPRGPKRFAGGNG